MADEQELAAVLQDTIGVKAVVSPIGPQPQGHRILTQQINVMEFLVRHVPI